MVVSSGRAQERILEKGCMLHTQSSSSPTCSKPSIHFCPRHSFGVLVMYMEDEGTAPALSCWCQIQQMIYVDDDSLEKIRVHQQTVLKNRRRLQLS